MSCNQLMEFCLDYLEGELPDDEQVRFRRHLGQCPDCVTFFETYRRTAEISRRAVQAAMPEALKRTIQSFLRERCNNRKT